MFRFVVYFLVAAAFTIFANDQSEILLAIVALISFIVAVETELYLIAQMRHKCPGVLDDYLSETEFGKDVFGLQFTFSFKFLLSANFRKSHIHKDLIKLGYVASISNCLYMIVFIVFFL